MSERWSTDDYLNEVLSIMQKSGIAIQGILGSPAFTYTVGLYPLIRAEVITIGLDPRVASHILNHLYRMIQEGLVPADGLVIDGLISNHPVMLIKVTDRGEEFTCGVADILMTNGEPVPLYQLVWPLENGRWPTLHPNQPLLGRMP